MATEVTSLRAIDRTEEGYRYAMTIPSEDYWDELMRRVAPEIVPDSRSVRNTELQALSGSDFYVLTMQKISAVRKEERLTWGIAAGVGGLALGALIVWMLMV